MTIPAILNLLNFSLKTTTAQNAESKTTPKFTIAKTDELSAPSNSKLLIKK